MHLPLCYYGDPVLRKKCKQVTEFDETLKQFAENLVETMHFEDGAGLAAPQVGQSIAVFVVDMDAKRRDYEFSYELDGKVPPAQLLFPLVVVNPKIESLSDSTIVYNEGCLSFLDIRGDIERPESVELSYQDLEGNSHLLKCDGPLARCVLHELDHVEGVLFIDRMNRRFVNRLDSKLKRLRRYTRDQLKQKRKSAEG